MIIFFNKKTGEIIGTIEGRVHFDHHLKSSVSREDIKDEDIERIIIGYKDTNKTEEKEIEGKMQTVPIYEPHNLHLWEHQLAFEDPLNPRQPHKEVVILKKGKVIGFKPK